MKFTTGLCRLSYEHIFEPHADLNGEEKYSCSLLISKKDKKQIDRITEAFDSMLEDKDILVKLGGKAKGTTLPLHDGDEKDDDVYAGHVYLNARANVKYPPKVILQDRTEVVDQSDVYSGCYVQAVLSFYPYNQAGKKGIGVGLLAIRKIKDGEKLAGSAVTDNDWDDSQLDEDDLL